MAFIQQKEECISIQVMVWTHLCNDTGCCTMFLLPQNNILQHPEAKYYSSITKWYESPLRKKEVGFPKTTPKNFLPKETIVTPVKNYNIYVCDLLSHN